MFMSLPAKLHPHKHINKHLFNIYLQIELATNENVDYQWTPYKKQKALRPSRSQISQI